MKSKQVYEDNVLRTFVLILDKGDEAFEQIPRFAKDHDITGASLTAVGACRSATLGYFDSEISKYRSTSFDEQVEILSLLGDIATKDDQPTLHAHLVLGRKDSSAVGGHLQSVTVFPTMEVVLTETPAHLCKRVDPETGLALVAIDESSGPE
ncbi:DNA-binding protein [Paenarthrobacter sp. Z7-10]|uniref:PPC domain-containing DNA-binding protein n=1 Tax=Paenarthrobacter sp. Z7-10 TaxID=2787635 RepID=UPI0022A992A2|nr:PPC domain-containing DNA-binding protein [Paenarthrobacter sp. Z7-10]MCZ2402911.1 DNA-binding protein [Paenarthrobacter sp. Z7-10]